MTSWVRRLNVLFNAAAGFAIACGAWGDTETIKVMAPDGRSGDLLGFEADISGDYAIAGAVEADPDSFSRAGAAYIWERCNGAWENAAKLTAFDKLSGDLFAWSVSISGTTAIVGAPHDDTDFGSDTGSVYVFDRDPDGKWNFTQKLVPDAMEPGDEFGWDVWIRGDDIIAGAPYDDIAGETDAGSAYVYHRTAGVFQPQGKLTASTPIYEGYFGRGVGIDNNSVAVGAASYHEDVPGANRTYIFARSNGTWAQTNVLKASDTTGDDHYGITVSIQNDTLLVGAHTHDTAGGNNTGGAYIYVRNGNTWALQSRLIPPGIHPNDQFGFCTALAGDLAIVGAVTGKVNDKSTGNAYVFKRSGTSWSVLKELHSSDGLSGDEFANSVGISGDTAFVSAVWESNLNGSSAGSAYVFDIGLETPNISSIYPIRGTAIPNATVNLFVVSPVCGTPTLFATTASDNNGDFISIADPSPYIGWYLTAKATAISTETTHESVPVLIESPCALPALPSVPSPGDGSSASASSVTLSWSQPVAKSSSVNAWEVGVSACATPLDFDSQSVPRQIDGSEFATTGVRFYSTFEHDELRLDRNAVPNSPIALRSVSTVSQLSEPLVARFAIPVTCVSFAVDSNVSIPWTARAYDEQGDLISEFSSAVTNQRVGIQAVGIRSVTFIPSGSAGIYDFSFQSYDCPITYDVYFGTAALSLTKIATGLTVPQVTSPLLTQGKTYYWAVTANGPKGFTNGPIWSFKRLPQTIARDDAYSFRQDTGPQVLDVLDNDISPTALSVTSFTQPSVGQLVKNADNTFTYTAPTGFVGTTQFTYTIPTNGPEDDGTATVTIALTHVNHAPVVAHPLPDITVSVNSGSQGINASLVFSDPDGDTLNYSVSRNTNPALVTVTPSGAGYVIAYTPGATGTSDVTLRAADPGGLYAEDNIVITVGAPPQPPQVTSHPAPLTVNFGDTASFTCAATSQTLLNYRWQKNNVDLNDNAKFSGVTTTQLSIATCRNLEEGSYRCRISDGTATVYTNAAALSVRDPIIVTQPADTVGGVGGSASFEVVVAGSTPLTYHWYIGATALSEGTKYTGATTSRLIVHNLIDLPQNSDEQLYHCVITGVDPQPITTRSALLAVGDPAITLQPEPQTVREGATVTFTIVAVGTDPILYRWKKNGLPLSDGGRFSGTRTPTLTITGALDADEGAYACTAVGQEIANSDSAALTVTHVPNITGIRITPANGFAARNSTFTIEVLLDSPEVGLNFQWSHANLPMTDSARVTGSTTALLTVNNATDTDAGDYVCVVTDGVDTRTSPLAHITIGLAFTTDLLDAFAEVGQHFEWPVRTSGNTGPVTYSWFRDAPTKALQVLHDGPRFAGTDSDTLIIDPIALTDDGEYLVYAQDSAETIASRTATLHVSAEVPALGIFGLVGFVAALALFGARAQRGAQGKV